MRGDHVLLNPLCWLEPVHDIKLFCFLIANITQSLINMTAKNTIAAIGNNVNFPFNAVDVDVNITTK
ncbi:Uncharacterised protein [Enterobacter roggenkampii]|uniref:Uncharacterized protein n=1 Tax=Enterobacter roggenkampii TaxID=1812935 RepID=A0ABY0J209_9ENTR|nr:Uncharacterised protein [Enterobacter roggenkampii]